jgi:hypothetical protein
MMIIIHDFRIDGTRDLNATSPQFRSKEHAQELFDALRNHAETNMDDIMAGDDPCDIPWQKKVIQGKSRNLQVSLELPYSLLFVLEVYYNNSRYTQLVTQLECYHMLSRGHRSLYINM